MKLKVLFLIGLMSGIQLYQPLLADSFFPYPYSPNYHEFPSYPTNHTYPAAPLPIPTLPANTYSYSVPVVPSYNSTIYGTTTYVTSYVRGNSAYIAGYPRSDEGTGVHCHNYVCDFTGQ